MFMTVNLLIYQRSAYGVRTHGITHVKSHCVRNNNDVRRRR